mgnify:CR=1 FL=1
MSERADVPQRAHDDVMLLLSNDDEYSGGALNSASRVTVKWTVVWNMILAELSERHYVEFSFKHKKNRFFSKT